MPVFVLPNAVLFPGIVMPLHIHEPRYQQMLNDVMAGTRQLVLVRAAPARGSGMADIGCLAQVVEVARQGNGTSDVLLRGEARVRLVMQQPEVTSYPRCLTEPWPALPGRYANETLATLRELALQLGRAAAGVDGPLSAVLRASADPTILIDLLAASLVRDVERQQTVLASQSLARRLELVLPDAAVALLQLRQARPGELTLH